MGGSAYIYEDRSRFEFFEIIDRLDRRGITLWYPGEDAGRYVSLLTDEGKQAITPKHRFLASLHEQPPVLSLQLWFSDALDLYCRLRFFDQLAAVDFGFDGIGLPQRLLVISAIQEGLDTKMREGRMRGIVVDADGQAEEYDWDRFFVRGEMLSAEWRPDILGFESLRLGQVDSKVLGECCKLEIAHFILLRKNPVAWET